MVGIDDINNIEEDYYTLVDNFVCLHHKVIVMVAVVLHYKVVHRYA